MMDTKISRPGEVPQIPGYKLLHIVGKGGMGEVYQATQLSLQRTVAVKLLKGELAKDPQFVNRFEKEGAALATLLLGSCFLLILMITAVGARLTRWSEVRK